MRITFIAPQLREAFGQERAVSDSIALLKEAGHCIETLVDERLLQFHSLSNPKEVHQAVESTLKKLSAWKPDLVHFVDQYDFRIMRKIAKTYPTLLTAHTVAPTCPASHRLIYRQEICPKKSGVTCLLHQRSYGCLRHFKNDLHKANAVQNFLFKRWALQSFQGIIAISKYIEDTLAHDGFDKHRLFQVYNPVPALSSPPLENPPRNLIVTASRLVELKGIEFTLRALKNLEHLDWTFWILGAGPEKARLEALTEALGLQAKVHFKGQTNRNETLKAFASSLFVTQTNVGAEGFGLSVAEAQSIGKPVVAFNVPAINEIVVHGETGFLVPPRDISELSQAMEKLLKDGGLRTLLGSQAKTQIRKVFSPEAHLQKTLQTYEVCLRGSGSGDRKRKDARRLSISPT